ncbi:formate dehydrogenase accessory sulfurtransferase FdhD [Psychromonas sp. 14N.309.X.WAT.B.A12]|uniref:formate dehydrogenase accessory sulfurtransferase FdhD n=1 Tax=Psychromonas sp. 14N.309.X.WAT.B.A12 TaxID=2998322 RepID=UPI0025B15A90|nr:formate dehydrogenase accessory sulfurtransferase FdhD [Psychromonas sp. 14N.309.X.WAT.B.A12]MDN2662376.1 formate dehydrogenase accessory sulfurtransferase FdhD [Psychromonas sp. 14N.309.X.WAT.B.A12]
MSAKSYQYVNRQRYRLMPEGDIDVRLSEDVVISEDPLNIVLHWTCKDTQQQLEKTFMVSMRTPGQDALLVTGLLLSYAIIQDRTQIKSIESEEFNQCDVLLSDDVVLDWASLTRQFVSHSGCGICGANDVKKLAHTFDLNIDQAPEWLPIQKVLTFSSQLREQQTLFSATGGVHSAGVFTLDQCLAVHEDVGRHNAVDKVIGELVTKNLLDKQNILMLSGRVSFELMQKAVAAKMAVVVAIGAPSSLAVAVAKQFNITLIGFVSDHTCNVYHGDFRLKKTNQINR